MPVNGKQKKDLGYWGEHILDLWMEKNSWKSIHKNLKIKKGEIDRIYFYENKETKETKFCISEIKTTLFYKLSEVEILFTETGIKRYLKQRQIRNLYKYGENLIAHLKQNKFGNFNIYLRFFIVFKCKNKLDNLNLCKLPNSPAIKQCCIDENYLIFSITPEFTNINSRKSLLQVKIW